ncbi:MAG: hypothetical protein A3D31_01330 [Candidatus Fluviicola riflensis]|nr:MAG: hypothetical protein CHH17_04210 [Candidatus Fluviicola riflensis]OGS76248.1 MAG: hypothetical protein A3D31_01330 [Candidatus Fluviicola riflensis]OGS83208.1 MAG: hypothetical protein A2724_00510 [Fluviicola sp. RIFCSPHIGHO2_01_FULL_43_53]OGS83780.1 MAG: hypothetical protein A3E30_17935 [Fluviicola sp. RIFCSPHIGHO2_12_FULL_43_24]
MKRQILFLLFLITGLGSLAQPTWWMGQKKPYKWQVGISWNAVDDDGRDVCQPFDVKQSWNYPLFPSRIMVDRYLKKGLSLEFAGAYNNYTTDKLVNDTTGLSGLFISTDLNTKFSFYQLFYPMKWFDPYVSLGLGLTHRDAYSQTVTGNLNINVGFNFWIYRNWGLQLQTSGKLGINGQFFNTNADYMQHSLGVVYKFTESRSHGSSNRKKYKWTKSRQKYRGGKKGKG